MRFTLPPCDPAWAAVVAWRDSHSVDAVTFSRGHDTDGRTALRLAGVLPNGGLLDVTEATLAALLTVASAEVAAAQ